HALPPTEIYTLSLHDALPISCYFFARELQKQVDVPMGLVEAAWGGSRIQAWTSGPALRALGGYEAELDVLARYAAAPVEAVGARSEEHTSELQSRENLVCRLL